MPLSGAAQVLAHQVQLDVLGPGFTRPGSEIRSHHGLSMCHGRLQVAEVGQAVGQPVHADAAIPAQHVHHDLRALHDAARDGADCVRNAGMFRYDELGVQARRHLGQVGLDRRADRDERALQGEPAREIAAVRPECPPEQLGRDRLVRPVGARNLVFEHLVHDFRRHPFGEPADDALAELLRRHPTANGRAHPRPAARPRRPSARTGPGRGARRWG